MFRKKEEYSRDDQSQMMDSMARSPEQESVKQDFSAPQTESQEYQGAAQKMASLPDMLRPRPISSVARFDRVARPIQQAPEKPVMRQPQESAPAPQQATASSPFAKKEEVRPVVVPTPKAIERPMILAQDRNEHNAGPAKRVLRVGEDTVLKGEVSTCDRLIVEGTVDAVLTDVHTIEITETGTFKGSAIVEDAEISGQFDGDLEVRGHLLLTSTGRITGKVSYSEIEIHRGGKISGKVVLYGSKETRSSAKTEDLLDGMRGESANKSKKQLTAAPASQSTAAA